IGAVFITIFYTLARNLWEESEPIWEGTLSLIASVVITVMSVGMLRVAHWRKKWEDKLRGATESYLGKSESGGRWSLVLLPFTVVCREGLESVIFMAGIGFEKSPTGLPIPIVLGIASGFIIGWIIYHGSHKVSLNIFIITTTTLLLFIAAGLFVTAIGEFQEVSKNPGIQLWSLNCCDPESDNFWRIMHSLFGWNNKSTVGTFCGYFSYWIVVIVIILIVLRRARNKDFKETNEGTSDDLEKKVDHLIEEYETK
ncbi:13855_t:CDS:2, partial [Acaulospora morrowiae]